MTTHLSAVLFLIIAFFLGGVVYFPTFKAPFIFDDYEFILNNPLARDVSALLTHWPEAGLKFFTYITFICNFIVGGLFPQGYHLVNVLLHIYNAWLLFVLTKKILQTPQIMKMFTQQQKDTIPFFCGLLFLFHPVATSAVNYIWQRAELLTAAWYLSALICYVMARQGKRVRYYVAATVCFVVGLFCKGTIISLPLMIILFECAFWPLSRKKAYTIILVLGGLFFVKAYLYLWEEPWAIYTKVVTLPFMQITGTMLSLEYFWTQLFVTIKYFRLAVFPVGQNFDYDIALAVTFWEPRVYLSAIILLALLASAIALRNRQRLLSVGIFWFLICLLPAALLSGREPMWEYRMYMALSGLLVGIVATVVQLSDHRKITNILFVVAMIFAGLTFARNWLWESPERLLLDNIKKSPLRPNPYQLLGAYYLQEGRIDDAKVYLEKTISLAPDAAESYNNLGLIAKNRGDIVKAREMFEAAIRYRPTLTGAYINLAYLTLNEGNDQEAESLLRQSVQVRETEGAYSALGKLYTERGQLKEAETAFRKALLINPQSSQAYFWYGEYWMARKKPQKARAMFKEAIKFNPRLEGMIPN